MKTNPQDSWANINFPEDMHIVFAYKEHTLVYVGLTTPAQLALAILGDFLLHFPDLDPRELNRMIIRVINNAIKESKKSS